MCSRLLLATCWLAASTFAAVTVRFDTRAPEIGPYPSDALTIEDAAQATGRRIDLPAVGQDYQLLNELDGFSPNARLRVRFSGPVNPETLKEGIRLLALDGAPADPIPVNQVVWDSSTYSAFAKPDRVLDQQRRYALLVTDAVRDTSGSAVEPDPAFLSCLQQTSGYCGELAKAIPPDRVVAASVFTTLSATSWLERARAALSEVATEYQRREGVSVFSFSDLGAVTLHMQTGADPAQFEEASLPFSLLSGVDKIAFGSFRSPNFLDSGQTIPAAPTKQALETPAAAGRIQFHALLPAREKPAAGYPVVIAGHGFGDNRFASPSALASSMAAQGLAVVAINAVGHGYGPETRLLLRDKTGRTSEVDGGGRSLDFNGDGKIEPQEGCLILSGDAPIGLRDCLRQTVADLMQLVRVLRAGVDLDGDGRPDLDPDRIYYAGISLGAIYGTMLNAVEPGIRSAVLNVGGGSVADIVRWGRSYHSYGVTLLGERGLLNREKDFDDAWPLRDKPVRVVEETSALEIQELFERMEWFHAQGDPLFFAGHLKKPILWMFARGDRSVPNPASSALVRAAGMRESAWLYRHDLARQILPSLDENPHAYLADLFSLASLPIALAAQQQAAAFLATGEINDPNALLRFLLGKNIFEVPDVLPEELNY